MPEPDARIGLVLAGGGARGAYEAGVLSVLLPELERRGELPRTIVGTSVGAITAAHLAANLHRGAQEATDLLVERWSGVRMEDVLRPVWRHQAPRTAALYVAEALGVPGLSLRSLLDPAPLRATLERWIDWPALHRNVRDGVVHAIGVVTTSVAQGRSVVLLEQRPGLDVPPDAHSTRWAAATLDERHVRASAAIPAIFPAVRLEEPAAARGFHFDGGTRLNTPIKPAIDLGVERVAIIATHALRRGRAEPEEEHPDFADGAVELLQATLVDPLIEDVRMLAKMNVLLEDVRGDSPARAEVVRRHWRRIPYLFAGPHERDAVADLALRVLHERFGGLRRLRSPDVSFLGRLVGGRSEQQGELLSYLLFRPEFATAAVELGRRDARRRLDEAGDGDLWQVGLPPS